MRKYIVSINDKEYEVNLLKKDLEKIIFEHKDQTYSVSIKSTLLNRESKKSLRITSQSQSNEVISPMPGIAIQVLVKPGDQVTLGQPLIIIEAMKMENAIKATRDGVVDKVLVMEKQEISGGQPLLLFV